MDEEEILRTLMAEDSDEEMDEFDLEAIDINHLPMVDEDLYKCMVYDLCETCHQIYLKDPLFKNVRHRFGFTEN